MQKVRWLSLLPICAESSSLRRPPALELGPTQSLHHHGFLSATGTAVWFNGASHMWEFNTKVSSSARQSLVPCPTARCRSDYESCSRYRLLTVLEGPWQCGGILSLVSRGDIGTGLFTMGLRQSLCCFTAGGARQPEWHDTSTCEECACDWVQLLTTHRDR